MRDRKGIALLLLGALLAGCDGERVIRPGTGLVGWVTVEPTAFRAGELVRIEVGIRNPTRHPIVARFTGCLEFHVTDANGVVRTGTGTTCDAMPIYEMVPGESWVMNSTWNGNDSTGTPLPAGTYFVHRRGYSFPSVSPAPIQILAP